MLSNFILPKAGESKYRLPEALKTPQKLSSPTSFGDEWAIIARPNRPNYAERLAHLLVLALSLPLFYFLLKDIITPDGWKFLLSDGTTVATIGFLLLGVLVYAAFMVRNWQKHQRSQRFASPILFLNQEHYAPGDPLRFSFQRDLKPGLPALPGSGLSACLRCIEVTRNSSGSTTTYNHIVHTEHDLGQCATGGVSLRGSFVGQLPDGAQPTRLDDNKDNWLVWELQVRQQVPGQLDETTSFLIPVTA